MKISVIGLGKLGLPLVAVFASKGFTVIGVDINPIFVDALNFGRVYLQEPQVAELVQANRERLSATTDYQQAILNSDVSFIVVPTPSNEKGFFSNRFLLKAIQDLGKALLKKPGYHLVVVTSTVMPGSMESEIQKCLEQASGRSVGEQLGLCYNPEFIALGNVVHNMLYPDVLLIGESDEKAGDFLENIYRRTCRQNPLVQRMNFVNAELAKISVNTFVTTKISYANMLSQICSNLPGADVDVVTQAVGADSRIGHKYLKGGLAYGGPCFPRDNVAFSALADSIGVQADLAKATDDINRQQTKFIYQLVENIGKRKIAILGLAYKQGTPIVEESQAIQLANRLSALNYHVTVFDPMAMRNAETLLNSGITRSRCVEDCVCEAGVIIIMTAWQEFKKVLTKNFFAQYPGKIVIDCWRMLSKVELAPSVNLFYLGHGDDQQRLFALSEEVQSQVI